MHVTDSTDDRNLEDSTWTEGKVQTTCAVQPSVTISRTFDQLAAFPFGGRLQPGLIVEGAGLLQSDIQPLSLDRAPLRLNTTLDSERTSVEVANPDPTVLNGAVTELKRDADARLTGLDVVPADITFVQKEVHSYEEAVLDMGFSLAYDSNDLQAKFESSFRQEERTEKHSIAVQMVQPMFELWVDPIDFSQAADYFANSVDGDAVQGLVNGGQIGSNNPPVLIDSVTYGRVLYFTITSTTVESASELQAAVSAAHGNISGGATLSDEHLNILSQSDTRVLAYGGDQSLAEAALKSGNLSEFFGAANTTTAAPLSLEARTLSGDQIEIADNATVRSLSCGSSQQDFVYEVRVRDASSAALEIFLDGRSVASTRSSSRTFLLPTDVTSNPGDHTVRVSFGTGGVPWPCLSSSFTIDILRDGELVSGVSRDWPSGVCWGDLEWTVNAQTGDVKVG